MGECFVDGTSVPFCRFKSDSPNAVAPDWIIENVFSLIGLSFYFTVNPISPDPLHIISVQLIFAKFDNSIRTNTLFPTNILLEKVTDLGHIFYFQSLLKNQILF